MTLFYPNLHKRERQLSAGGSCQKPMETVGEMHAVIRNTVAFHRC